MPVEINQYDSTLATYDVTMGNNVARDTHCEITMGIMMLLGTPIVTSQ